MSSVYFGMDNVKPLQPWTLDVLSGQGGKVACLMWTVFWATKRWAFPHVLSGIRLCG